MVLSSNGVVFGLRKTEGRLQTRDMCLCVCVFVAWEKKTTIHIQKLFASYASSSTFSQSLFLHRTKIYETAATSLADELSLLSCDLFSLFFFFSFATTSLLWLDCRAGRCRSNCFFFLIFKSSNNFLLYNILHSEIEDAFERAIF